MGLGRRLAAPVLGPIHTVGHQFHRRAIDHMDGHLEAESWPAPFPSGETWRLLSEMIQGPPEKLFAHLGRTLSVGVGKTIATGRRGGTNTGQRTGMQLQRVTQIVKPDTVG